MRKVLVVLRRELVARVKTKAFVISTLLLPVMMMIFAITPALLSRGSNRTFRIAIVDATGDSVGVQVEAALASQRLTLEGVPVPKYELHRLAATRDRMAALRDSLVAHTAVSKDRDPRGFDGVLVLTDSTVLNGRFEYLGSNTSAFDAMGQLESSVSKVLMASRLERAGVSPSVMSGAMIPADMQTVKVSDGKATGQSGAASFVIAYVMGLILYITMIIYGQQTLTSVIEEKTSRIMEVLMSSLRPFEMLLGKILGVGATGLLQLGIWAGAIFLISTERVPIAHAFGVSADAMQQLPIPTMPVDLLVIFLLYFVLGFLLYGALYAAIGSMFNTVQEAQQVSMFLQMAIVIGFLTLFAVMKDPTGGLAVWASILPFVSPFVMPARWSLAAVPAPELAASLVFSVAALLGVTWLAGRIYRTGILMYGTKPSFREVFSWIRAK